MSMTRPPFALSQSSLKVLLACPYSFRHLYLTPDDKPAGERANFGRTLHLFFAEYIGHLARVQRKRDGDTGSDMALATIESGLANGTLLPHQRDEAERVADLFIAGFELEKKSELHYTERMWGVSRDWRPLVEGEHYSFDYPAHRAHSYASDLVCGQTDYVRFYRRRGKLKAEIYDFKSGLEFVKLGDAAGSLQLGTYAALLFAHYPELTEVTVVLWGVQFGRANKDSHTYNRSVVEDVQARYEAGFTLLDALHTADYWQPVGLTAAVCAWCPCNCPIATAAEETGMAPLKPLRTKFGKRRAA